jgi:hypothetical protein
MDTACFTPGLINLSGTPPGGIFSGTGVTAASFDPQNAGVGSHLITYTFTDKNDCTGSSTDTIHVLICSGTNEISSTNFFEAYPNPAADEFVLILKNSLPGKAEVKIYNAFGQLVLTQQLENNQTKFHIPVINFADGIYMVQIQSENLVDTVTIMVQH